MKRALTIVLIALLAAWPSTAAVETTTVNGKVVLPNGATATGGTVTAVLNQPGSTPDGAFSQAVGGRTAGTIAADGTVSLVLVPNDAITPAGTYYDVRVTTTGPVASTWTEKWSLTTGPDPVNIGAITRLEVAPGITVGTFVRYVASEPSGACLPADTPRIATASNKYCECEASAWSCTTIGGLSEASLIGTARTFTAVQKLGGVASRTWMGENIVSTPLYDVIGVHMERFASLQMVANSPNIPPEFRFSFARGTWASPTAPLVNDWIADIRFSAKLPSLMFDAISIRGEVDGTPTSTYFPGRFVVDIADGAGALTNRLKIDSAGLTTVSGTLSPTSFLEPICAANPPTGACTNGQVCGIAAKLFRCNAGAWVEAGAPTLPAGTGTEFQYRNGAVFGAAAGTGWNASTSTMTLPNAAPGTDNTGTLGTAALRFAEMHARELRGFCPGGPTGAAGAGVCYDPDDPLGPAFKAMVGGQVLYVQVSTTHP